MAKLTINVSELIRSVTKDKPLTAVQIQSAIGVDKSIRTIRGVIVKLVESGDLRKIGFSAPYSYTRTDRQVRKYDAAPKDTPDSVLPYTMDDVEAVRAKLNFGARQRSQLIRQAVKLMPMRPMHIAMVTGLNRRHVSGTLSDMAGRGYVERLDDGRYSYIKSPRNEAIDKVRDFSVSKPAGQKADPSRASIVGETVDEFLARGGVIEKCETELKFERLTRDEIIANTGRVTMGHQSPSSVKYSNNW